MSKRVRKSAGQLRRRNFVFSERASERLARLAIKTDATSDTEVIKAALLTYEALVSWLEEGATFFVRENDGQLMPCDFLIDVARPRLKAVGTQATPLEEAEAKKFAPTPVADLG